MFLLLPPKGLHGLPGRKGEKGREGLKGPQVSDSDGTIKWSPTFISLLLQKHLQLTDIENKLTVTKG